MSLNLGINKLFGGDNNDNFLIYTIIIIVLFVFLVMPMMTNCKQNEKRKLKEKLSNIFSGTPNFLFNNKCSPSCCINSGWPYPPELLEKDISKEELKQYVPNNFACALGSSVQGGCLCVKQKDLDYLTTRGGNTKLIK
jgi:hypothetical protein